MRLLLVLLVLMSSGCVSRDMDDLHAYAEEVNSRGEAPLEPIPEFKPAEYYAYQSAELQVRDPFTPEKEEDIERAPVIGGIRPDEFRPREELEAYSLDTLRMVGTWTGSHGVKWGLVKNKDGVVYRVLPGNYMGRNDGRITSVHEDRIELVEIVPDRVGGYIEQPTQLALGE